jgi:hypothetical protein
LGLTQVKLQRFPLAVVLFAYAVGGVGLAQDKPKAAAEKVTLQYRVARDAFAPSQFVVVSDGGISPPVVLTWNLLKSNEKGEREAQERQKARFDQLIRDLEARQINGVEFECRCELIPDRATLRIMTVPELTAAGRKRIRDSRR